LVLADPEISTSHLVLIPSYNTGADLVIETVRQARAKWAPVWVVVDGSTDGSGEKLDELAAADEHLRVLRFARNRGKGAVVLDGAREAIEAGFTHVLTMDADGQHSADDIEAMMMQSAENPEAAILGQPVFDDSAPALRVHGRKISNALAALETLGAGIGDSLFGMRVYPLADLVEAMDSTRYARRFDFEPEIAVRLAWQAVELTSVDVPVRYLAKEEGGVSHFHYLRDNLLLAWMNWRLLWGCVWRLPRLVRAKWMRRALGNPDSRLSVERARLRVAGRFSSHWFRGYSRSKMKSDPVFESVVTELRPLDGAIFDFGCGQGVLAFYLKERGCEGSIRGMDRDEARVVAAQKLVDRYYQGMRFEVGDVRDGVEGFQGHVVITDVLQYLSGEDQPRAFAAAAKCLPAGGRLVIRSAIRDGSMRFRIQRAADLLARLVRWIPAKTQHYPSRDELVEMAQREGLVVVRDFQKHWGSTPLNLYLVVFGREPLDAFSRQDDDSSEPTVRSE
jgi:glycosyltransferase involved in cell wall biosynthesis